MVFLEMLETAKLHLKYGHNIHLINKTFQDLIKTDNYSSNFDLIVSPLTIHQLYTEEKASI
jgi:hypothetical protein